MKNNHVILPNYVVGLLSIVGIGAIAFLSYQYYILNNYIDTNCLVNSYMQLPEFCDDNSGTNLDVKPRCVLVNFNILNDTRKNILKNYLNLEIKLSENDFDKSKNEFNCCINQDLLEVSILCTEDLINMLIVLLVLSILSTAVVLFYCLPKNIKEELDLRRLIKIEMSKPSLILVNVDEDVN